MERQQAPALAVTDGLRPGMARDGGPGDRDDTLCRPASRSLARSAVCRPAPLPALDGDALMLLLLLLLLRRHAVLEGFPLLSAVEDARRLLRMALSPLFFFHGARAVQHIFVCSTRHCATSRCF